MRHALITASLLFSVAACAPTRAAAPPPLAGAPEFKYPALHAAPLAILVEDVRSEHDDGDDLAERVRSDLATALGRAGVPISPGAPRALRVRIVTYRSDFGLAQWKGCAAFESRFVGGSADPRLAPVERCVSHFNTFGWATADEVLADAYKQAMTDVLRHLDDLPAPSAPPPGSLPPPAPAGAGSL